VFSTILFGNVFLSSPDPFDIKSSDGKYMFYLNNFLSIYLSIYLFIYLFLYTFANAKFICIFKSLWILKKSRSISHRNTRLIPNWSYRISRLASMYAEYRRSADSERRCTHSHAWRASSPVNRATHYHKCPRRARPTRKSVSQIARVGLCHLSPPARSPATAALLHDAFASFPRSGARDQIALVLPSFPTSGWSDVSVYTCTLFHKDANSTLTFAKFF